MKIIGITGKSGSGKSTLTQVLSEKWKCSYINIDKIGHKATNNPEISKKLCDIFGNEITGDDAKIDRKKLGNLVFSSKEKMGILEELTWGYMQKVLEETILKEKGGRILLEWALLPISQYWEQCDTKILLKAPKEKRKKKVMQRDGISEEYFLKRDSSSLNYRAYRFDYVFKNDYQTETLKKMADIIVESLKA